MKKSVIMFLVIVLIGAGLGWYYQQSTTPPPMQYASEIATLGSIETQVLATGTVQAMDMVEVGSQVTGQVNFLGVALGQAVKKGELIAKIDNTAQQNALKEEELNFQSLVTQHNIKKVSLAHLQDEYDNQKQAYEGKVLAHQELVKTANQLALAKQELKLSELSLAQAKLKIATAKDNLDYTNIKAPIDGTVVAVVTKQGQTINASSSSPTIVKIAQMDTVQIKVKFSESDMPKLKVGMNAYFSPAGKPDDKRQATLDSLELSPISESGAVYYAGTLTVPNPNHELLIGMSANVVIITDKADETLLIPSTALGEPLQTGEYQVQVLPKSDNTNMPVTPITKTIKIGLKNATHAQVLSGLSVGDEVVVVASDGVVDELDEF